MRVTSWSAYRGQCALLVAATTHSDRTLPYNQPALVLRL